MSGVVFDRSLWGDPTRRGLATAPQDEGLSLLQDFSPLHPEERRSRVAKDGPIKNNWRKERSRNTEPNRPPTPVVLETKSAAIECIAIAGAARDWLGTPYRHQASTKHQGTDCLGLIRGVYRDIYGREPETPPPYTPDWNERRPKDEPLLSAARRHLVPAADATPQLGRVLVFRILADGPAKHCGIVSGDDRFIHAYAGRAVVESWLGRWWRERIAGAFDYPGAV